MYGRRSSESGYSPHVGWRLRRLRFRRGLQQTTVARAAGVDPGYLNRVESGKTSPKPESVNKILDALDATRVEREAVFHVEVPPPAHEEVVSTIELLMPHVDEAEMPLMLIDEHWFRLYYNRAFRAAFGLSEAEYRMLYREHALLSLIDPASPLLHRFAGDLSRENFALRATVFKALFSREQFDRWYYEVEEKVRSVPWAAELWDADAPEAMPLFLDQHETSWLSPSGSQLRMKGQFNRLMNDPRFNILIYTPADKASARTLRRLREEYREDYSPLPPG